MADSTSSMPDLAALCDVRGWSRTRLVRELRSAASGTGRTLPDDDSLKRMIRLWVNGSRAPSPMYVELLRRAFRMPDAVDAEQASEFSDLLDRAESQVDSFVALALESHTQSLRVLDRQLGGQRLFSQVEAHAKTISDLVSWAPFGRTRSALAAAGAEAAALAGWQALDMGKPKASWLLHESGKALAHESQDKAVLAHVTAQQAYALLDSGRVARAVDQFEASRSTARTSVPTSVRAWLTAAEAEARAAAGESAASMRLLDSAIRLAHAAEDPDVPYVVLSAGHMARWRAHCLTRVGHPDAIRALTSALQDLDPDFTRAAAGVHADLATAYLRAGDRDAAEHHAAAAQRLCALNGSHRQRVRVRHLVNTERQQMQ